MQEKGLILSATNVVMSLVATILQVATKDAHLKQLIKSTII